MKSEVLEREILTHLERKLLNEVVRPSLSHAKDDHLYGKETRSESLNFADLLKNIKDFYHKSDGNPDYWHKMIIEIGL